MVDHTEGHTHCSEGQVCLVLMMIFWSSSFDFCPFQYLLGSRDPVSCAKNARSLCILEPAIDIGIQCATQFFADSFVAGAFY